MKNAPSGGARFFIITARPHDATVFLCGFQRVPFFASIGKSAVVAATTWKEHPKTRGLIG
jgi:hypothetical protein